MRTTSEKGARPRNCKTRPYCPEWHSALIRSNTNTNAVPNTYMNTNVNANTIPTQIKYEIKIYKDISCTPSLLAMSDTQIDLIQCLNFAQN